VSSTRFSTNADYHLQHRAAERSFRLQAEATISRLSHADTPILDLGCGTAPLWPFLDKARLGAIGADYDLAMLRGAARRTGSRFALAEAGHLPFRSEVFGAVTSLGLFEYLPQPLPVLSEIERVLRPRGQVHITVPHAEARYRRAQALVNPLVSLVRGGDPFDLAVGHPPNVAAISSWTMQCGFELVSADLIVPQVLPWPFDRLMPRVANALADRRGRNWATILIVTLAKREDPR